MVELESEKGFGIDLDIVLSIIIVQEVIEINIKIKEL